MNYLTLREVPQVSMTDFARIYSLGARY